MWSITSNVDVLEYVKAAVQIVILAWLLYRVYLAIAQTKATQIITVFILFALGYGVSYLLQFEVFLTLYNYLTLPFFLFMCILYHPELRRAFSNMFTYRGRLFRMGNQTTSEQIEAILNACVRLVDGKRGALIVFPRHTDIKTIIDSGTRLNADLSSSLICTIFDHDTPLHDGAIIVQSGRLVAGSCYLPLSEQTGIKATFGTRHRAALGLAEESDAVILIVSEETGAISLAYNANIYYDLDTTTIQEVLLALLSYKDVTPHDIKEAASSDEAE